MSHHRRVYVVARDGELRRQLARQVSALGAEAWPFPSGLEFLKLVEHLDPGCVLIEMDLADVPGLELVVELRERDIGWPIIGLSGSGSLELAVATMKAGAMDFLGLPLATDQLAFAIAPVWQKLEEAIEAGAARRAALDLLGRLTARELDVTMALLNGGSNKRIAHEFGISVRTVEMHRAHIMAKLGVKSLAEVAVLASQAGVDLGRREPLGSLAATRPDGPDCRGQLSALAQRLATSSMISRG